MSEPKSLSELRKFLGMCNQLSKFLSELMDATKSLYKTYFAVRTSGFGINSNRELFIIPRQSLVLLQF